MAALAVPAGQGVAVKEEKGQYAPAGHKTGAPLAQKKEAGQGTQVSWRRRELWSATYKTEDADAAMPFG